MADAKTPALTRGPRTRRPNRAGLQGCRVTKGCRVVMRLHICATLQRAPRGNASTLQRAPRCSALQRTTHRPPYRTPPRTLHLCCAHLLTLTVPLTLTLTLTLTLILALTLALARTRCRAWDHVRASRVVMPGK